MKKIILLLCLSVLCCKVHAQAPGYTMAKMPGRLPVPKVAAKLYKPVMGVLSLPHQAHQSMGDLFQGIMETPSIVMFGL
jgi:hypothetical protein